ncbi:MAG: hypothetical protein GW833_01430 [Desulfuromonadales bacterium]|nr:hypothetical protein [Desulfuromonadales bacterium]
MNMAIMASFRALPLKLPQGRVAVVAGGRLIDELAVRTRAMSPGTIGAVIIEIFEIKMTVIAAGDIAGTLEFKSMAAATSLGRLACG